MSICQGHCVMLILTNVLPIPAITWVSVRTGPGVSRVTVPWGYKGRGARLTRITVRAAPAGTRRRVWTMSMDSRMLFFCLRYHYMFSLKATHVNLQSLANFHYYLSGVSLIQNISCRVLHISDIIRIVKSRIYSLPMNQHKH